MSQTPLSSVLGVDVGGTFTDFYLVDGATGETRIHKVPSTPDDPSRAILQGLAEIAPEGGVGYLAHGTTVATNALIQRRGARLALVTTKGFRDLLEIGRQTRPKIYDLKADHPAPLVAREHRFEVAERVGSKGEVLIALAEAEIARAIEAVRTSGAEAVAVCFLFSFLNPEHERRMGAALRAALPKIEVSLSSEVQPEFREYERLSTTVLNAFLQPEVGRYMRRLEQAVGTRAGAARIGICQSSGGLMSVGRAAQMPIRTALSGPAAGVVGAISVAGGAHDVITFDMGGTSTDVCLIRAGRAEMAFGRAVAGFPVRLPAVDIHTVGAGGGSIAHIDRDGLMKVGPQSAGAAPGPACYGRGGSEATVSDANLVLGRLPGRLAGGMTLDVEKAFEAVDRLAGRLGLSRIETALGIVRIVNANMVRAIRVVSVERGHDPRGTTLMPFGGAGALHAVDVAAELGIGRILVPPTPGILCAEGVAVAPLEEALVTTLRVPLEGDLAALAAPKQRLETEAQLWLEREGVEPAARRCALSLDLRYVGQNYEIPVGLPEGAGVPLVASHLRQAFDAEHAKRYGHADPEAPVEIVNLRVVARADRSRPASIRATAAGEASRVSRPSAETRPVWFTAAGPTPTAFLDRATLASGARLSGPAVIMQLDATTLLPPGYEAEVGAAGSLIIKSAAP